MLLRRNGLFAYKPRLTRNKYVLDSFRSLMQPKVRRLRQGWAVSNDSLLVVDPNRSQAIDRFNRLNAAECGQRLRPPCTVNNCHRPSVVIFNVAWLCAEHCSTALDALRQQGVSRPVEVVHDVDPLLVLTNGGVAAIAAPDGNISVQ
jgi:hypothetical protein